MHGWLGAKGGGSAVYQTFAITWGYACYRSGIEGFFNLCLKQTCDSKLAGSFSWHVLYSISYTLLFLYTFEKCDFVVTCHADQMSEYTMEYTALYLNLMSLKNSQTDNLHAAK